jgi:hypothetical protein
VPYGEGRTDSDFFLHVHPKVKKEGIPDFRISNCKVI